MSNGVPKWIQSVMFFDPYVSIVSAVVNSFHLLVLCQKSMRTSSTNEIMAGIALTIICWMYKSISYLFRNAYISGVCWIPSSYFSEFVSWIATSLLLFTGSLQTLTPCIMYPFLTLMLFNQLRKFGKTQEKLFSTRTQIQSNSTTRSILCITIAYIISQLPLGLLYLRQSFCTTDYNCYIQLNNLMVATVIPSTLTTITHMPICFVLSSQYRQAFKSVFKFGRKNEMGPEETDGTVNSSPTINENPKDKANN